MGAVVGGDGLTDQPGTDQPGTDQPRVDPSVVDARAWSTTAGLAAVRGERIRSEPGREREPRPGGRARCRRGPVRCGYVVPLTRIPPRLDHGSHRLYTRPRGSQRDKESI